MTAILIRLPEDLHRELKIKLAEMGVSAQAFFLGEAMKLVEARAKAQIMEAPERPPPPARVPRGHVTYPPELLAAIPDLVRLWEERLVGCARRPTITAQNRQLNRLVSFLKIPGAVESIREHLIEVGDSGWSGLALDKLRRNLGRPVVGRGFVEDRGKAGPIDVAARLTELADEVEDEEWRKKILALGSGHDAPVVEQFLEMYQREMEDQAGDLLSREEFELLNQSAERSVDSLRSKLLQDQLDAEVRRCLTMAIRERFNIPRLSLYQ